MIPGQPQVTSAPCSAQNILSLKEISVDETTWRILSWLINHSGDTSCTDVALRSIPGARARFSETHLFKEAPPHLILERLGRCLWRDSRTGLLRLKTTVSKHSVLQFCRALSCLVTSTRLGLDHPMFKQKSMIGELEDVLEFCASLFVDTKPPTCGTSASYDLAAIAASALVPFAHSSEKFCLAGKKRLGNAQDQLVQLAQWHVDKELVLHPGALSALVEASPHWAIEQVPRLLNKEKSRSLTTLVKLLESFDYAMPQFQHSIGLSLTLASMMMHRYPDWELPPRNHTSKERALRVYCHYATKGSEATPNLIAFGLLGILDRSDGCVLEVSTIEVVVKMFAKITRFKLVFQPIHSLPNLTITDYISKIMVHYLELVKKDMSNTDMVEAAALCIKYLWSGLGTQKNNLRLYTLAVSVFCTARSDNLRAACSKLLNNLQVPSSNALVEAFTDPNVFSELFKLSVAHNVFAPTAMRHLWSMTSGIYEAGQPGASSVLSAMLKDDGFASRHASAPGEPGFPQNVEAVGLADIWHPLLEEMSLIESIRLAVNQSGIIPAILAFYKNSQRIQTTPLVALERLERLNYSFNSGRNLPEEAEGC
ncbi:hypothetical protein BDV93DRAFT_600940 [Ceratobasidium sp. AG-I]|nr:hypothetical protein BDV93DRAFT_600940 [Ceratobasidium sp. AG-I]